MHHIIHLQVCTLPSHLAGFFTYIIKKHKPWALYIKFPIRIKCNFTKSNRYNQLYYSTELFHLNTRKKIHKIKLHKYYCQSEKDGITKMSCFSEILRSSAPSLSLWIITFLYPTPSKECHYYSPAIWCV